MSKYESTSVKKTIDELNESFFLPDIQREYVWLSDVKNRKIELLFDSLMRGYPIGTLLFWKLKKDILQTCSFDDKANSNEKLNFQIYKFIENYDSRRPHNESIDVEKIRASELKLVLDGQQRLTSLFIGLRGSRFIAKRIKKKEVFVEQKLYLNLDHKPEIDEPDDVYNFEFLSDDELSLKKESGDKWFKVGDILNLSNSDIRTKEREQIFTPEEADILYALKECVEKDDTLSYYTEDSNSLDKVLNIFIRVNSGGQILSYSDLLMSILTSAFDSNIRQDMNDFVEDIRSDFPNFGRDQVLKTALFLTNDSPKFILANFSKEKTAKIKDNWTKIKNSVTAATCFLKENGYAGRLSSGYVITALSLFFFKKEVPNEDDKREMLKFVQNTQLTSFFSSSLDTKLVAIRKPIVDESSFKIINQKLAALEKNYLRITRDVIEDVVESARYGKPETFAILQLLYPNLNYNGEKNFHIDHIFPKTTKKKKLWPDGFSQQKNCNKLFNLQLLEGVQNQQKLQKDPKDWISENFKTPEKRLRYKEENFIPSTEGFDLDYKNLEMFKTERIRLIEDYLFKLFELN